MIAIVDYGMGNVRSLQNALSYLGCESVITANPGELDAAERIILPGVGAFGDAMVAIRERQLQRPLTHQALERRKPMLGICLGMQLFAKRSDEHGEHEGLGWVDAEITRLNVERPLKVPQVGWNELSYPANDWLFDGIKAKESNFYFVHSYHMVCRNEEDRLATTDYGGPVTAVIRSGNLVAAQFHPEKSQDNGLKFIENWVNWSP